MKKILYSLSLLLIMNCAKDKDSESKGLSSDNPFNVKLNEPIDYANVTGEAIEEYVSYTIDEANKSLEAIKRVTNPTLENTFLVFDDVANNLSKANNNSFMLYWSSPDSLTRAKGLEYSQKVDSLNTVINSDKAIFNQFEKFTKTEDYKSLQGHQKNFVDDIIINFKQSGVNLDAAKLEQFKTLKAEITDLSAKYSTNMNTANAVLKIDEEGSKGLPESFKDTYKTADGTYEIPVMPATKGPVMDNAENESVRKEYITLYSNRGADKNLDILNQLILKRYQLAQLLGYRSFAEYNLVTKMAKNPETVWEFINGLVKESKPKALKDVEVLKDYRNSVAKTASGTPLNAWDVNYYHNQILKNKFNVDNEKIREYLPMNQCLKGLFEIYQQLLGLEFREMKDASVWHKEVMAYEVFEADTLKGRFYLDLYPRPNKESWFYGVPLSSGKKTADGYEVPVAMLLGNFTRPTETMPSLLSHSELNTLFHEFGHIMNSMSYDGEYSLQAESKADFGEAMSQIFENWIWDYDILSSFAKHYKTGETLPEKDFYNMLDAKNLSSGLFAQGSLRNCIYDMNLYDKFDPNNPIDTDQLWRDIDKQMDVMNWYVEGTHPQASWIHINTHPTYYYGYLWSEVYAQDMFTMFEANGLRNQSTGVKYRKIILANGTQRDAKESVESFLGRKSNNEAYIKSLGLE
ncbi:Zn-dependent oligopeptidase [Subsaxibacter sp. CAU 1640]|uniref:M3 family metallopeptidase n=1 Tax=Subsaxibacter sp. CAU 1640 TaxID=2933271 RepID=UPI002003F7D5|nr:M3 family metallopeptidase [Subsaxibacter sp. CAU 1640]MCK7591821.1 Zn-dependent oligopeptidase [Subsaxibacter sp. CAU 1640]